MRIDILTGTHPASAASVAMRVWFVPVFGPAPFGGCPR